MNKEIKLDNIGYIEYQINYEVLDIINLFIEKNMRNKGYASSLLKQIEEEKVNRIMLEVKKDNIKAISLYKKHGYKTIHTRKGYYKDNTDALIMEKII